jgi:hypothetical protein
MRIRKRFLVAERGGQARRTCRTPGILKNVPMTGICRRNDRTTGKKSLRVQTSHQLEVGKIRVGENGPEEVEEPEHLDQNTEEGVFEEDEGDTDDESEGCSTQRQVSSHLPRLSPTPPLRR